MAEPILRGELLVSPKFALAWPAV